MDVNRPGAGRIFEAGLSVMQHIEGPLIVANSTFGVDKNGRAMSNAKGISIYVPPAKVPIPDKENGGLMYRDATPADQARFDALVGNRYSDFAFAGASRWGRFVNYLWSVE
jgi:hypothetical protein